MPEVTFEKDILGFKKWVLQSDKRGGRYTSSNQDNFKVVREQSQWLCLRVKAARICRLAGSIDVARTSRRWLAMARFEEIQAELLLWPALRGRTDDKMGGGEVLDRGSRVFAWESAGNVREGENQ